MIPNLQAADAFVVSARALRILVVADGEVNFYALAGLLGESRMHRLDIAAGIAEGRDELRKCDHDVCLFDLQLEAGSGVALLREAQRLGCETPIILLTEKIDAGVRRAAKEAGAVACLCKADLTGDKLEQAVQDAHHDALSVAARKRSARRAQVENGLRQKARLFDGVLSSMPAITWSVDADGTILEARGHGLRTTGLHESEVLGRNFHEIFPRAADQLREALEGGCANFQWDFQHDGRTHHFDGHFQFDTDRGCGAIGFSVTAPDLIDGVAGGNGRAHGPGRGLGLDATERRWLERRVLTICDAERQRIGADLHDGLGQQLTGLACLATAMRDRLKNSHPLEGEKAELIARIANEVNVQARAIARGLCPVQLEDGGLVPALEELARQSQLLLGVSCEFHTRGPAPRCDHMSATHLYRITQEAINNAVRHGGARHLRIALVSRRARHRLIIADDGRGFDATDDGSASGGGLRLMNYRATEIGAKFHVASRPGQGARVTCNFASTPNEKVFRNQGENARDTAETPDPAGR